MSINSCSKLSEEIESLFQEYSNILMPRIKPPQISHAEIIHIIDTQITGLLKKKTRKLSEENYKVAKQEFTAHLKAVIISLNLLVVPKSIATVW